VTSPSVPRLPTSNSLTAHSSALVGSPTPLGAGPTPREYPGAFRPLSREDVAGILGISIRTLENWVKQERLPAPTSIGGRRYWHPERFFAALDAMLQPANGTDPSDSPPKPQPPQSPKLPSSTAGRRVKRSTQSVAEAMLREAAELAKGAQTSAPPPH
jgi:hypothetical protein